MTLWVTRYDQREASAQIQARLTRLLDDVATENDALITSGRRIVSTWSEVPAVVSGSREECEAAFARLARFAPSIASPTRITAEGTIDCGGRTPAGIGQSVGDNPLFRQVLSSDSISLGPYLPADSVRDAIVPLNIALRDSTGRVTGVLSIGLRLSWFRRLSTLTELPVGTSASIADSSGRLIALIPYGAAVGSVVPDIAQRFEADRQAGRAGGGIAIRTTPSGNRRLIAHRQLTSSPGTVVRLALLVDPEVAFAGPQRRRLVRLALLIGSAVAALLIAWFGAEVFVLRDVNAILGATRRLGTGDLTARTGVARRRGELAQLAESFDTMASQLERRQDRLRHAERMESLGRLAGGVAHDFNNMLTAIAGSADLALMDLPPDHPVRADLTTIMESASRSSTLTRQLLDFSRRSPLTTAPQPIEGVVRAAAALLGRVVPASVALEVHTNSQWLVRVDAGRIEQALLNLAVNARDAMPTGGTLRITLDDVEVAPSAATDSQPPPGRWVRLAVQDSGSGMPADVVRRVFEPFFTTKEPGQGTGLGMAMVYGTVQHHRGHVHVDSSPGVGTLVTIWLPEATASDVPENIVPSYSAKADGYVRVLVAEDQPEVRLLMQRMLTRAGYDVVVAEDGRVALALAEEMGASLGLLVTDYDMPNVRGDVVAATIRASLPTLPVVLMSGFTSDGWPADLVEAPHTVVIEKPFSTHSLLQAIGTVQHAVPEGS
jgi:signal transduction histidine kinase/ActR/RegA family two-component response regulator